MTLYLNEPPLAAPVTLADAKAHLRVETGDEDALLGRLIAAATGHLENATGLALLSQKWRLMLDAWPAEGPVLITKSPVLTLDGVTVRDAAGLPLKLSLSGALLDGRARPARLYLDDTPRPGLAINGIQINFTAGFGAAATDVPDALRQAILLHVARLYETRGAALPPPAARSDAAAEVPPGWDRLVAPYRRRAL